MDYFLIIIAGFGGGVVRGLMGYIKHQYSYKNVGFNLPYFFSMMFLSGIVGTLCAIAINNISNDILTIGFSASIAFVVGYAGGDFLDNVYKIIIKKKD
ncbi:hypothetical protein KJ591_00155 [Patescibacteria group bacterium]|nr:hypothetical protein [Patescibacteria group bacterium]MBU4022770.1 hypothetical protein [Patescibacteria group bacterium]MBU4162137.1 hypothetical protein [Patescibacteria group bacterium]